MLAPLAVIVALKPLHTDGVDGVIATVGEELTVIVIVLVPLHDPVVPVTVYVVVAVGIKPTPFVTPPDHEYEVAPPPVSVTEVPAHTVLADAFAVTVGEERTETTTVAVFENPPEVTVRL